MVLTAALTTRQAVVSYLLSHKPNNVWLVGSGWEGEYSLEDTVCAGAIIQSILEQGQFALSDIVGNDAALAATSLYMQWKDKLQSLLYQASHGQRLLRKDNAADIDYCAQLDVLDIVPIQQSPGILVWNG